MKPGKFTIIYVYDALCGWCYGFSLVINRFFEKYQTEFDFNIFSGGMILGEKQRFFGEVASYIKSAFKTVENNTDVKFGNHFINFVLEEGKLYFSSEKPVVVLSVFKSYQLKKDISFVHDLQFSFYYDFIDFSKNENYIFLIEKYKLTKEKFIQKLTLDKI